MIRPRPPSDLQQFQTDRSRLGRRVAGSIRDLIMSGRFAQGERLRLGVLSSMFNVSATPIREALALLETEGLVESEPHRGYAVRHPSRQDVLDLFDLHAFIAGQLAERAVTRLSGADLDELVRIDQELRDRIAGRRGEEVEDLNHAFHRQINRAGESAPLLRFLAQTTHVVPRRFYAEIPGWLETTAAGHGPIVEALHRREGPRARVLMEEHVRTGGHLLAAHLAARGFWLDDAGFVGASQA